MNTIILYTITVLIWGTTWFAIKLQIGLAPDEVSIFYRCVLASLFLIGWCKIRGFSLRFSPRDHLFLIFLGLSMFSLHCLFVFNASKYVASGVVAVVFSGVSFLSIFNNYIFFKTKPSLNITLGTILGIMGLCVFFWSELTNTSLQNATMNGLFFAGIGTCIFSLGSSISKRNNNKGIETIPALTMGMVYGTCTIFIYIMAKSSSFSLPQNVQYWAALLYLVIPGTMAFFFYLKLIKNIGPEKAGYTTVLFPVVALFVSWVFEDYVVSISDLAGLVLVISGNILLLMKRPPRRLSAS